MTLTRLGKCLPEPVSSKAELQLRVHLEKELWGKMTERALMVYRSSSMRFTFIQVHKFLLKYIHPPFKLTVLKSLEFLNTPGQTSFNTSSFSDHNSRYNSPQLLPLSIVFPTTTFYCKGNTSFLGKVGAVTGSKTIPH